MENEQHIDIQEVTYFQGTLGENKDINCIITNKKWTFRDMIIPINHVAYINTRVQHNKSKFPGCLIIAGIGVMVLGAIIPTESKGVVGAAIVLIGLGLILSWLMKTTEYFVKVGTSATTHNFRCTEDTFMEVYKGMQEALNNRIF